MPYFTIRKRKVEAEEKELPGNQSLPSLPSSFLDTHA
jgi:hypothetical protein